MDCVDKDRNVVRKCSKEVRETLVLNVDFLDWRICGIINLSVFWIVYTDFAEVGNGAVEL